MDTLNIKAVLDYPVYLKLKSEQDKAIISANTINKDLGALGGNGTVGATAAPTPQIGGNRFSVPDLCNGEEEEKPSEKIPDKIYNEILTKDKEISDQETESESDDSDKQKGAKSDEHSSQDGAGSSGFLSGVPISPRYEKKALKLINLLEIDINNKGATIDNEHYSEQDLKEIFYQLYIKKAPKYNNNIKLASFLKALADRNLFNIVKNKSLLSHLKKAWYIL